MLRLVVEGAVGYYDIRWSALLQLARFVRLWVLRTGHDVRQLGAGLPEFVLLGDLFGVGHDVSLRQLLGFGASCVVDLVAGVRVGVDRGVLFLLFLDDSAASQDVEARLGLGEDLSILVLFEADILFLGLLLGRLGLVD